MSEVKLSFAGDPNLGRLFLDHLRAAVRAPQRRPCRCRRCRTVRAVVRRLNRMQHPWLDAQ